MKCVSVTECSKPNVSSNRQVETQTVANQQDIYKFNQDDWHHIIIKEKRVLQANHTWPVTQPTSQIMTSNPPSLKLLYQDCISKHES